MIIANVPWRQGELRVLLHNAFCDCNRSFCLAWLGGFEPDATAIYQQSMQPSADVCTQYQHSRSKLQCRKLQTCDSSEITLVLLKLLL